jgi:GAF domain-containing protein
MAGVEPVHQADNQEMDFLGYDCGLVLVPQTSFGLHREIAELSRRVHAETRPHYEPIAAEFAALAPTHIPCVADAGALVLLGNEWREVSAPETSAGVIEALQAEAGEGPAIVAAEARQVMRIDDIAAETRWPRFTEAALARSPARAMLCCPLYTHIHTWGVLILLADHPYGLDDDAQEAGTILATHLALTLDGMHHDRHYRSALGSRDIIGQAKGVLMERFDIDTNRAFALLTRLAEESHRPVVVVAKELLETNRGAKT